MGLTRTNCFPDVAFPTVFRDFRVTDNPEVINSFSITTEKRARIQDFACSLTDFAGESLIGRARSPNHDGSLQENAWPCSTTLIARDNWERKVIRDETDDTCGDVGRWAVRSHRR